MTRGMVLRVWRSMVAQRVAKSCRLPASIMSRRKLNITVLILLTILLIGYLHVLQQPVSSLIAKYTLDNDPDSTYCMLRKREITQGVQNVDWNLYKSATKKKDDQECIMPDLDPCDPEIAIFDKKVPKVNCTSQENWVYVENGTFRISSRARRKYGKITCEYAPIVRGKGDYTARHAEHIKPMLDGAPIVTDVFKVACISPSGKRYHNIHAGIAYNRTLLQRSQTKPMPPNALGYDVFMFGFDSTSRMSWMRNLHKSRQFFLNTLGGLELEGYNIVGDGTVQALLPILAGNTEHDLPTARRGEVGAVEVDDFPWIWKHFKKAGYVTAWGEDMSYIGTFQMRLKGFKEQPTDHSLRTYFMLAEPMYNRFQQWCMGSEARHLRFLNWFRDLYHMYREKPKFMFGFHSEFSHTDNNNLKKMDEDFYEFLKYLHSSGYLNNTILILMGDHGARFTDVRSTPQGKLEERLPYFAFSFPSSFYQTHPQAVQNFRINTKRLTTPFDIHETFHDMLNFGAPEADHTKKRGISLFREVPKERECEDAEVMPHWCACLRWVSIKDTATRDSAAQHVISIINNLTSTVRNRCALLKVKDVISISKFSPNPQVLMFKKSSDMHGDNPDMSDKMILKYDYFQIVFTSTPGDGRFEATMGFSSSKNEWHVSEKEISRTNRYGAAPDCIAQQYPNLRPYCFCL